jgi:hypothetical protein
MKGAVRGPALGRLRRAAMALSVLAVACMTGRPPPSRFATSERLGDSPSGLPAIILPVVVHHGSSKYWRDADSLRGMMVEVQRIFDQANIILRVSVVDDTLPTDSMDVVMQWRIWSDGRRAHGVSFGAWTSAERETYVFDVTVQSAPWRFPRLIPLPRCFRNSQSVDSTFALTRR